MSKAPRISICIPAYQAAGFVATAVESALLQTVPPFEIVVSDNWSSDGTRAVLERYSGRVALARPWTHLGMSDHYWYLTECVSGDYMVWLDADNALDPRFIETVAPLVDRHTMVSTGRFECDSRLRPMSYSGLSYWNCRHRDPGELFAAFLGGCRHSHSGTVWERRWIRALPRLPREAEYVLDWYVGLVTAAYRPVAMVPAPRHYFRLHDANASHSQPGRWKRSAAAMLDWLASEGPLDPKRREQVRQRAIELEAGPEPSRLSPARLGKKLARAAVSAVACHTYRHPAYLR